ncbi:MAG: bifunctional phosphoribosylaminoimidazolecarboxamide formyltransferase/IMP cyclohydrolase [Anaerolineales bacterium]
MPRAVLSVYNKTGLVGFAQGLHDLGWSLIASGGTAGVLLENGIPVVEVAEYTGSPEILGGRVKTLHPAIHGGLLARSSEADYAELLDLGWDTIDLAAVNLYPFEEVIAEPDAPQEQAIENIDIGGVTLIRAAAKNHQRVVLVSDPDDYLAVLEQLRSGGLSDEFRRRLAIKGFALTAKYDTVIVGYLSADSALQLLAHPVQRLRYGENPHQSATLYAYEPSAGPLGGTLLQGKELSYNNLLDLDAAWKAVVSFEKPTICIVKHLSPCGIASAPELAPAFEKALASDPISAFGGVIASNRPMDGATTEAMENLFVECVIAPGFRERGLARLAKRKNCRLVDMPNTRIEPQFELRSITRGILRQELDRSDSEGSNWRIVSARQPTEEEKVALRFAWMACQHVKSNAIVFARGEATVGIGGGQPNRVDCVRIAAQRAGEKAREAVMASDAFFPFPDSIEVAAKAGITAVIQPGGSVRDAESIAAADTAGMAMVTTGVRHFRH